MPRTEDIRSHSEKVVLRYVGKGRTANGIPDRDLTAADVARLAFQHEYARVAAEGKTPDPRKPKPAAIRAAIEEVTGTGLYAEVSSAKAAPAKAASRKTTRRRPAAAKAKATAATAPITTPMPSPPAVPADEPEG